MSGRLFGDGDSVLTGEHGSHRTSRYRGEHGGALRLDSFKDQLIAWLGVSAAFGVVVHRLSVALGAAYCAGHV